MPRILLVLIVALSCTGRARAEPSAAAKPVDPQLAAIDRDDAAAEAALAKGDVEATLRYFDYFGHEQEDFARATLEYRLARQKLGEAVRDSLGRRAWGRAARALGVPRHWRGEGGEPRTVRREGDVVYLKAPGDGNEVPYVNVGGTWKVSVREVLVTALRARFGEKVDYEEADLFVLAGKMGRVMRERAGQLSSLAQDVRAKRVTSSEELDAAIERIRRPQ